MAEPTKRNSPRRRFPLTLTAVAGTVIAVPVYFLSMSSADEAAVASPPIVETAAQAAPPTVSAEASTLDRSAPEPMPDLELAEAEPMADAVPMAPPPAAKTMEMDARRSPAPSKMRKGASGSGRASRIRSAPASAEEAGIARGFDAPHDGWADKDIPAIGGEMDELSGPRGGYDEQLQANILTAGRTSDLEDHRSLDDLRRLALSRSPALAQAIPNHIDVGAPPSANDKPEALDIAFVLDTTGSMGDELAYLKVEMRSIAETIATEFPGVQQRYALVAYRDFGDDYVVRHTDFTSVDTFVSRLGQEGATGGGDFPEAMDQAMETTTQLSWSRNAANMVFLVADAPPHDNDFGRFVTANRRLSGKGISVYPVGASGVETVCEYLMRWAARVTGGQYIFLTDHSGVGNSHADPHVDQYQVKTLRDQMLEVIRLELDGTERTQPAVASAPGVPYHQHDGPSWWDQHGLFILILAGVFIGGFAGDMALHHTRRAQP